MTILWLLAIASLAGCAGTLHWTKTGATADDFNRDSYECAQGPRGVLGDRVEGPLPCRAASGG
jgi:hypothetical protein